MKNLIIAGSINMDIVVRLDKYPEKGETVFGKNVTYIPGGKGANQARAITRLGGKVRLISKVGSDQFGETLKNSLTGDKVSTKDIKISKKSPSGTALIGVDKNAENRIILVPGANFDLSPSNVSKIDFIPGEIAISDFEIPENTVKFFFQKAKKGGSKTVLNPSPVTKMPPDFLELVDYLVINEHEFSYLSELEKPEFESPEIPKASAKIVKDDKILIITFGASGSVAIHHQKITKVKGFKVKAIDTTGAGDSFLGAFTVAIAEGKNLKEALIFANAAAALKVTKRGASSMPYRKEVETFIQKNL